MGRKEFSVDELVEVLHQWHKGRSITQIKHSVGMDRKIPFRSYNLTATKPINQKLWPGLSDDRDAQIHHTSL